MASAFGHAYAAFAISKIFRSAAIPLAWVVIGVVCSILPDADVLAFRFGIPYGDMFGHRGFTHSIFFAVCIAIFAAWVSKKVDHRTRLTLSIFVFIFLATMSHSILDAMTTGGKGVAFFAPFSAERYFFPWRVIKVSPLSVGAFMSEKGIRVLKRELLWIGIPSSLLIIFSWGLKRLFGTK